MKKNLPSARFLGLLALGLATTLSFAPANAQDRYRERPPVVVSPDLTAPWLMQLGEAPRQAAPRYRTAAPQQQYGQPQYYRPQAQPRRSQQARQYGFPPAPSRDARPTRQQQGAQQVSMRRPNLPVIQGRIEPQFLPQMVSYETKYPAGTIVIDTNNRFLYLVMDGGQAKRYGVGVGKPGFEWAGEHKVTRKAEWPTWIPPQEMISREAAKGHYLPARMDGGPENPLGARALYLGSTLYRIHGTNAPWTIGSAVSSGCIRMRNEDVTDLYGLVDVGTRVIVI
ncbi:L,D-transpeptidase family protein [Rhizobiales bacterium RZME27]|uniref:L,D-transpeptidase family protein n=1 Tax=Endobacterium cereale TaxID=2663029 RepID=A0A6A8ACT8_9HYPH|nr:L,D-transpeptidase [Endobacterium cereale]MEB2846840.1 L,D-transpeptidase [Endobacterium cereale]MQY47738.1 L,D-transpeptidase family protein [Endobacterium cereale]